MSIWNKVHKHKKNQQNATTLSKENLYQSTPKRVIPVLLPPWSNPATPASGQISQRHEHVHLFGLSKTEGKDIRLTHILGGSQVLWDL